MTIEADFGLILKKYRNKVELSQEALALKCGLDRTYISLLERGKRKPTINSLFTLAKALDVKPSTLIEEIEVKYL
ncbi:helix-turn-helix domain-containing protein [Halalkalibacter alkaliphilus]|uniref:Helix-turn-helix domain-containing protein n=1 Tax=Halalkalibacter alkaliphilus TaxID=2917993 RepID=A0A9X2CRU9_9BACI|nr:helix-turn-helix transcriptional regulator [Halalkalibacter alkaliphilus]MCL7747042.1 helix-turn-helix domain-containing protein [Halalkalibacter alkaliphilus]